MTRNLHWQILAALVLAVLVGWWAGTDGGLFGFTFYGVFKFIGTLFLNALKMIIVPLIAASMIISIAGMGGGAGLGRMGAKTIVYYMATSFLAILAGLFFVNLFSPGIIDGVPAHEVLGLDPAAAEAARAKVGDRDITSIADVLLSLFPPNIIEAASNNGQMLGIIVFSILYGFFLTRIEDEYAEPQYKFWRGMHEIMMRITDWVIRFTPIGVFGLVAKVVAEIDESQLDAWAGAVGLFAVSVLLALATHFFVTLPLILRFVGRVNPLRHYRAMAPALLTAFSTSSSAATLPLTMECTEKNAGVSERTTSFVLPLGATINMDGTALYECVAAMFIAQAYGVPMDLTTQFIVVFVALLTSIGVAAIPSASLVAIAIILTVIGVPLEGIGMILVVDRILDMCRTTVNVFSDSCGAVVIARSEGETVLQAPAATRA